MKPFGEKRNSKRSELKRPVVFARHNSDTFYNADILNTGDFGACLQSVHSIKPETKIYIMTEKEPIDDSSVEFPEACFAEVVWCKRFQNQYRAGIKFVDASF